MATVRIVIWDAQGIVKQRCEDHVPEGIRTWLDKPELPGWIESVEVVLAAERHLKCVTCLAEVLQTETENSKPA